MKNKTYLFELTEEINYLGKIQHLYTLMECDLSDYKTKYPDKDVSESQKKIDQLKSIEHYVGALQKEYNLIMRLNSDYHFNSLSLTNKVAQLEKEVLKQKGILDSLAQ